MEGTMTLVEQWASRQACLTTWINWSRRTGIHHLL